MPENRGYEIPVDGIRGRRERTSGHREADPDCGSWKRTAEPVADWTDPSMPEDRGYEIPVDSRHSRGEVSCQGEADRGHGP